MGSVVIVGGGAIGTWLAVRLAAATDLSVTLLGRSDTAHAAARHGLLLETLPQADPRGVGGEVRIDPNRCMVTDDLSEVPPDPDLLVFAVRAYQTVPTAMMMRDVRMRPKAALTLQNGLGNAEALARFFGDGRTLAGTTSHGVTRLAPGRVRHTGPGDTVLGPWHPEAAGQAARAAAWLDAAGIATKVVADARPALWLKVAVSAAINPLTAIHRVPNGVLLDDEALRDDLVRAAREVALVATAEGTPLAPETAEDAALTVARRTAQNRSSMLQALEAGRPLETEAITGEVVRRADRHGVAVPVNTRLLAQLRALGKAPSAEA